VDDLPDALDRAVAGTDLGVSRAPMWWRLVGGLQWLVTFASIAGLLWLLGGYGLRALGLPPPDYPRIGDAPLPFVLLFGGLLAGAVLAGLIGPVAAGVARRAGRRAEARLRAAVAEVAQEYVVTPSLRVLTGYGEARAALVEARR
jgi:hypothetical protein